MSVLSSFSFKSIGTKPTFLQRITGQEGTEITKYGDVQNTRSARPGIPSFDYSPSYTNRLWLSWCYWYEDEVSILCDVLQKMRDEVVRYGFKWKPAFAEKCQTCNTEYDEVVHTCDVCGSDDLRKPDRTQLRLARVDHTYTFVEKANINEQTLQDVIKQTLFHMLVTDNAFILAHKEYHWDDNGEVVSSFPMEFLALDPRDVIKLFDFETGYPGKGRVCLNHRSSLCGEKDMKCPTCGKGTYRAFYQVFTATKTSTYYIKDEICHLIYYYPSIIYGNPKCFKIKDELIAYHMIEKRVRNYYEYCKVPGILFIPTDNPEGIQEMWQKTREDTKDDPFTPAVLGVSEIAPTNANFIKLMEDPNANLIAVKEDLRDRIASSYGITMAFTNDTSQTGGLKNDKNLISLSDRTIRSLQKIIDNKALKWMTRSMGIIDWVLECEPNINDNKLEEEEVIASKLQNMEKFMQLGIEVQWKDDNYVVFEKGNNEEGLMAAGAMGAPPMDPSMGGAPMGAPPMDPSMGGAAPMGGDMMGMPPMPEPMPEPTGEEMLPKDTNPFIDAELGIESASPTVAPLGVRTELSKIMGELFFPEKTRKKRRKQAEEDSATQGPMGGAPPGMGMPPMGGAMQ